MIKIKTFETLSGSVYQVKTEDDCTFVRRVSGHGPKTDRLAADQDPEGWQQCSFVKAELGLSAIISWGSFREPLIPGTYAYPFTTTSPVSKISEKSFPERKDQDQ